jgi:Tol biopolymer transport system component
LALSPDDRHIAVARRSGSPRNLDIWLVNAVSGARSPLTNSPGIDSAPIWSSDSKRIAFLSERQGTMALRQIAIDGTRDEVLAEDVATDIPTSWSPDGRHILLTRRLSTQSSDIWALPLFGDRKPFPVAAGPATETSAVFSPDGHWVAFTSNETGPPLVFVQPFPGPGFKRAVSTEGGGYPVWGAGAHELFFMARGGPLSGTLMALPFDPSGHGAARVTPQPLFYAGGPRFGVGAIYAVTRDGQRFLAAGYPPPSAAMPVTVVVHWPATLNH